MLNRILFLFIFVVCSSTSYASFEGNDNTYNIDSIYKEFKNKIDCYNSLNQEKNSFVLISNSLTNSILSQDRVVYQELVFYLISEAIRNLKFNEASEILSSLFKTISSDELEQIGECYYWKSLILYYKGCYKESETILNKSEKIFLEANIQSFQGEIYYLKARIIKQIYSRYDAIPYYLKATEYLGKNDIKLFFVKLTLINTYSLIGEYGLSLKHIDEAILNEIEKSSETELKGKLEDFNRIIHLDRYGDILQNRAYVYREMAKELEDSLKYLKLSFKDSETSIQAIEKYKKQLNFDSDILKANRYFEYAYYKSIEAIARLYDATGNDSLVSKALVYSEMEKASALLRGLQKDFAIRNSGIPDSLIQQAYILRDRLDSVEAVRYKQKANFNISDKKLLQSNTVYYNIVIEVNAFEQNLEQNFPEYKENKYNVIPPNIEFIKELSKEKQIFQYVLSNEKVYAFFISDGEFHFKHFYFDKGFKDSLIEYHQNIAHGDMLEFSMQEQLQFVKLSNYLYKALIEPFEAYLNNKPILIIPDNELSLIPFETLVMDTVVSKTVNYKSLSYMVNKFDISYTYSLTLLEIQSLVKSSSNLQRIFAMAPGYNALSGTLTSEDASLREVRDSLGELQGARKEVQALGKRWQGKRYFNKAATEEEFKKNAGKYSVLHLAMHTLINDEEPMYSKLVFTPDADSVEDGLLNTYELRSVNLNADLVVLSACNTGFGKYNRGEGIIGLSRGFLQSGCKSLLATLWSVSDLTSLQIINGFYKNIDKGFDKAISLSNAKRNYISKSQGIYSHPYFWAGYIAIGNTDALNLSKRNVKYWLTGIVAILFLFVYAWRRYGKEKAG